MEMARWQGLGRGTKPANTLSFAGCPGLGRQDLGLGVGGEGQGRDGNQAKSYPH